MTVIIVKTYKHSQCPHLAIVVKFACFIISTALNQMGRLKVVMVTLSPENRMHAF